jgi:hypothetical protein
MIQLLIPMLICAAAPGPMASTRPAMPANLRAMQIEAFDLMRQEQIRKAAPVLEKVYKETPVAQRNRALVLNHAVLDLSQKTYVMRAIKDLTEYLVKNRDPDEYATNLLGGALNIAVATDPKLKNGNLWQTAFREWDRRNYVLDHSRKGWRRWGTRWLSDADYAQIQAEIAGLKQAVKDQTDVANRAHNRATSLIEQYSNAVDAREKSKYIIQYLQWQNQSFTLPQTLNLDPSSPNFRQVEGPVKDFSNAYMAAQQLGPEMHAAIQEVRNEMRKLKELEAKVVRPQWPTTFEPVDPTGPEADQPINTGPPPTTGPVEPPQQGLRPLPQR